MSIREADAFPVVVFGASFGGIPALSTILANLPEEFPADIAIVQHRSSEPGLLAETLVCFITEFGRTPLYTRDELGAAGVDIVLYCCAAYRAMNAAALATYEAIRRDGTQQSMIERMQTRAELYKYLDYDAFEQHLDRLFAAGKGR